MIQHFISLTPPADTSISGPVVIFHRNAARTIKILMFLQNGSPGCALRGVKRNCTGQKPELSREAAARVSWIRSGPKFVTITFVIVTFHVGILDRITFRLIATRISGSTKKRKLL